MDYPTNAGVMFLKDLYLFLFKFLTKPLVFYVFCETFFYVWRKTFFFIGLLTKLYFFYVLDETILHFIWQTSFDQTFFLDIKLLLSFFGKTFNLANSIWRSFIWQTLFNQTLFRETSFGVDWLRQWHFWLKPKMKSQTRTHANQQTWRNII